MLILLGSNAPADDAPGRDIPTAHPPVPSKKGCIPIRRHPLFWQRTGFPVNPTYRFNKVFF